MTFGVIKTTIEKNLLESYKSSKEFKKTLREFKQNVLNNKSISRVYSLYDQLSKPQGLSEKDANEFLNEGLGLLQKIMPNVKLPKTLSENVKNDYKDIDTLVYTNKLNLHERVQARKSLIKLLTSEPSTIKESVKLPTSSMVKIANTTLENYIDTMDEKSKQFFFDVIKKDSNKLEEEFKSLKENTMTKLNVLMSEQKEEDLKKTISETIERLKNEECSQINYVKLLSLTDNL